MSNEITTTGRASRAPFAPLAMALGLAGLLAAGAVLAETDAAGDKEDKEKQRIHRRARVVMVGEKGEEPVLLWDGRQTSRGYLGIGLTDLTPELRAHFGVPEGAGVLVSRVEPGSPAEKAGVKVGDVLARVDGEEVESSFDVRMRIRRAEDGAQLPLEVWRNGKAQTLSAAVEKRERPELDLGPLVTKEGERFLVQLPNGETREAPFAGAPLPMERLQRFRVREAELEKRIKDLERRLQDLERRLQNR